MEPENVVGVGMVTVVVGIVLTAFSIIFFAQVYACILSLGATCPSNAAERFGLAFPLMILGGYMIIVGAIVSVGGYIVSNLRANEADEDSNS